MAKKLKTMKISELITLLKAYQRENGDVPVFHQKDSEGNGFGTINPDSIYCDPSTKVGKAVMIHPFDEGIEDDLYDSIF